MTDLALAAQHAADARRLDEELAQARLAQRSFVSLRGPVVPGYDLASHYEAAREIGGDFFELFHVQRRLGRSESSSPTSPARGSARGC